MELNNIGFLLINSINKNNDVNKRNLMKNIKDYNDNQENKYNNNLEDISYYLSTYENKRNENRYLYDEYVQKRLILYN